MPMSSSRFLGIALSTTALALFAGCGSSRPIDGLTGAASGCVGCHGGLDNATGAPPYDAQGLSSSAAVGAHTAHVDAGVRCDSCHVVPTQVAFPKHQDGTGDVTFGTAAQDPVLAATPAYDRSSHTCSNVYCHSPSTAPGGTLPAPAWNAPPGAITGCGACHAANPHGGGVTLTQCGGCHPTTIDGTGTLIPGGTHANRTVDQGAHDPGWTSTNANGVTPHGLAATYQDKARYPQGLDGCRACHGANLSVGLVPAVPSCDSCHAGGAAWRTSCVFCHGDAARLPAGSQLEDAAPPRDVRGNTVGAKVGAHQVHLLGGATFDTANTTSISNGIGCDDCHGGTTRTLPSDLLHVVGTTEVTLKVPGTSTVAGTYDRAAGTCNSTYCHGQLPRNGNPNNTVSFTATSLTGCDACHAKQYWYTSGAPALTDRHSTHSPTCSSGCHSTVSRTNCSQCHPGYQRQTATTPLGTMNRAIHVNGQVDVSNSVDPLNWNPSAASCSPGCHTANGDHTGRVGAGTKSWR